MKHRSLGSLALAVSLLLISGAASAQSQSQSGQGDHPMVSFGMSPLGWTPTPATYLFAFDAYLHLDRNWSVGPQLQIGAKTGDTLVTFTLSGRYHMDVFSGKLAKARPYIQGGIGLGHLGDTEFLFNTGIGVDVPLTDNIVVGSNILFNVAPGGGGGVSGSGFFFSWQVVHLRYQF